MTSTAVVTPHSNEAIEIQDASTGTVIVAAHAWYGDVIGGSFRLASEFAESLADQGHEVHYVCCAKDSQDAVLSEEHRGLTIHRYPPPSKRGRGRRLYYHVRHAYRIAKKLREEHSIAAVSGHSPLQFFGAALAMRRADTFLNYTVHSPFDDELTSNHDGTFNVRHRFTAAAARHVDRMNIRMADRVQTDSRYTLEALTAKHGHRRLSNGVVAPGWVNTAQFRPVRDRHALRQRLGDDWPVDVPVFFTLRRLESRMGLETLIQAAHKLKKEDVEFRVFIGGSGSLQAELEAMIANLGLSHSVKLLGRVPEEQLPLCYAAADCFVLPTRALECFGLIVLEAFSCNTPVIASHVAAIPELASVQGEDWLFTPGDEDQLAQRMSAFVTGRLHATEDLREFAMRYDRAKQLRLWSQLLQKDSC